MENVFRDFVYDRCKVTRKDAERLMFNFRSLWSN